jgi:arginyl-tRNA synthetase
MATPLNPFARACAEIVAGALDLEPSLFAVSAPPRPELGDFAVGCFPAAKAKRAAPPRLAAQVVEAFEPTELIAGATAAGPFVNFRADRTALYRAVIDATLGDAQLLPTGVGAGKTICIDFSSPNISKHLAYHHIRSTVIGHVLGNLYRSLGYRVVGINHLGDWGTTHGMLLAAYHRWGIDEPITVGKLNDLYVRWRALLKEEAKAGDSTHDDLGRAWFKKLEDGDPEARALWERFKEISLAEFQIVYDLLGIEFDEVKGESEFVDDTGAVLELLEKAGLPAESEGALVVPLDDLDIPPLLLKKKDGATLYATRDLAAAIHRWDTYHFERSLYVVDRGQGLHFRQLFETLARAGCEWAERCAHVPFGLVRIFGKKTTTRQGNVVLLREVIDEATERSAEQITARNPEMKGEKLQSTARALGIGGVVFANLIASREKDVDFDLEDVVRTDGDTGVYVQYGHARCKSIATTAGEAPDLGSIDLSLLASDYEWSLARQLTDFADVVARAADANEPHHVSRYLLDVTKAFARWWTAGNTDKRLRIIVDDPPLQAARVALTAATGEVLRTGLALLGIDAPHPI